MEAMLNRGDEVLVRTFGDYPRVRRLWDATAVGCVVAEDDGFARLNAGDWSGAVGVPAEDVFELPPARAAIDEQQPFTGWDELRPYRTS